MPWDSEIAASVDRSEEAFPCLHVPSARTIARDRHERLVSVIDLAAPTEEAWQALVDPQRLATWFAVCHGSLEKVGKDTTLDFEDGEFFLVRTVEIEPRRKLRYLAWWLGIGQATSVTWSFDSSGGATQVTVTEQAVNPPWDWQTWNGGGWPGILDQLAAFLRTGTCWRWPWRRMGPYVQIELPVSIYAAWDALFGNGGTKYWLLNMKGIVEPGANFPIMMGDASGIVEMIVDDLVQPGQKPPSFLPYIEYRLHRSAWGSDVPGRLWIEPAGWGKSLLQAFHYNWESVCPELQLSERRILTGYWTSAACRALHLLSMRGMNSGPPPKPDTAPHNWSSS
jgi:uncharacterized protein YndB with AHSA1/START domain